MELKDLKPAHKLKKRKRVGRGGKRGTYSGKGMEGQKARSGRRMKPAIRTFVKKYPKLRGYKFSSKKSELAILNIEALEKNFQDGETINPEILIKKRLIRKIKGKVPEVKVLGRGKITKRLIIENCRFSENTKKKIEEAGGKVLTKKGKK